MVKEKAVEDSLYYQCENCGFFYKSGNIAKECEKWCKEHNSCNLEITRNAVKI